MKKGLLLLVIMILVGALSFAGGEKEKEKAPKPSVAVGFGVKAYELDEFEKETGKKLLFNEAPELKQKVASGEIPPLKERLPEEPLVIRPEEEIGQYGGTWSMGINIARDVWRFHHYEQLERLVHYSPDFSHVVPNIAKSWEMSEDAKSITFILRKGIKWSDGDPFDVNDVLFWWNDIMLNEELFPTKPEAFMAGGKLAEIEKIDDYTFRISFAKPNALLLEDLSYLWAPYMYVPEHYLKQFHPKYTSMDEIKKEMKKRNFDEWPNFFKNMYGHRRGTNIERPQIEAWIPVARDTFVQKWVRNPYYWKVDTEGNQLPYIDKLNSYILGSWDAVNIKALAGDIDCQRFGGLANYPVFMENREKSDYRVIPGLLQGENQCTIYLNYSLDQDPVLREIFLNKQFRIALSVSINREEIANLVFKGMVEPSQICPTKETPWYEERIAKLYTEYDPAKANKLLDEIELKWDANHEYRLRKDGERLKIVNSILLSDERAETMELIKGYWKDIGIEVVLKPMGVELWVPTIKSGKGYDTATYSIATAEPGSLPLTGWLFPIADYYYTASRWGLWGATGGKEGEEPPAEIKQMLEIYNKVREIPSLEERNRLIREALASFVENLWAIGIVDKPKRGGIYIVAKNSFRNVPSPCSYNFAVYHPGTWFFKE